jgi:flagellar biosynthesis/type III secretory pathway chaperone
MTNGTDPLDDLTEVLAAQAAELRSLVPLLDEQQTALTRADSGRVAAMVFQQEPIVRRLLRLDQQRQALATSLAAGLGLGADRVSLSALLARVPAAPAALTTLRTEIRQLLEAVDVRTRRNAFLLERAVAVIQGLVRTVMAPAAEPAPVYVASGRPARPGAGPTLLDRSA